MANKRKQKKTQKAGGKSWRLAAMTAVVLALCSSVYVFMKPTKVTVPDLVGQTEQEARAALDRLSLGVEVKSAATNSTQEALGRVESHVPSAGAELPKGAVVTLYVHHVQGVEVPGVVGKTRSEAEDILRRAGFTVEFTEAHSEAVEIGKVISQSPIADSRLERGQMVMLTVSGGRGEQEVPDLKGLSVESAREQLKKLGLELVVLEVAQNGFRQGDPVNVLRQEPDAGSSVSVGSRITVFVPIPVPEEIPPAQFGATRFHAPRLEGLTVGQARELAKEEGLDLEFAESADDTAVITFQEPPPGDPLPKNAPSVLVRTASSSVVPGLTGLSVEQAKKKIQNSDLVVGGIKKTYGPIEGEVLGQRPSAGIEVLSGSQVDLVIADPKMSPDSARMPGPAATPAYKPAPWVE